MDHNKWVGLLREVFRNLESFRALYEQEGVDTISSDGIEINLWDIEYLYGRLSELLPPRQYQAIELFLVQGLKETQVAAMMGIELSNPIGSYATSGLRKLVGIIESGDLPGYKFGLEEKAWANSSQGE